MEKLVEELIIKCQYLNDQRGIKEGLMGPVMDLVPFDACGITTAAGTGLGLRGLLHGFPADYLIMWANSKHEKLDYNRDFYTKGWDDGYYTLRVSGVDGFIGSTDYNERYLPYGLKDVIQTAFFERSGRRLGVYAIHRFDMDVFTGEEVSIFNSVSPYIFSSFLKYRWLLEFDFFAVDNYDEVPFGVMITDLDGKVTYLNDFCENLVAEYYGEIPKDLPEELKGARDRVLLKGKDSSLFRANVEEWLPCGAFLAFRCNKDSSFGLPVDEESLLYIIDVRYIDQEMKEKITLRELEVIKCLSQGMSNQGISDRLFISERTVHTHIRNIFDKLEVENRLETITKSRTLGLI